MGRFQGQRATCQKLHCEFASELGELRTQLGLLPLRHCFHYYMNHLPVTSSYREIMGAFQSLVLALVCLYSLGPQKKAFVFFVAAAFILICRRMGVTSALCCAISPFLWFPVHLCLVSSQRFFVHPAILLFVPFGKWYPWIVSWYFRAVYFTSTFCSSLLFLQKCISYFFKCLTSEKAI